MPPEEPAGAGERGADPGRDLPALVARLGVRHAFIVTDRAAADAGALTRIGGALPEEIALTAWQESPGAPTESAAREAAELFVVHGCDGIIGIGGPNVLALARLVGLAASHRGPLSRYAGERGAARIRDRVPPIVVIDTTEATEATTTAPAPGPDADAAVRFEAGDGRTRVVWSRHLAPRAAIRDPVPAAPGLD